MAVVAVTIYGVCALSFMMAMYALERRDRRFVLAFALRLPRVERVRLPLKGLAVRRGRSGVVGNRRPPLPLATATATATATLSGPYQDHGPPSSAG